MVDAKRASHMDRLPAPVQKKAPEIPVCRAKCDCRKPLACFGSQLGPDMVGSNQPRVGQNVPRQREQRRSVARTERPGALKCLDKIDGRAAG